MKFDTKVVRCAPEKIYQVRDEYRDKWIVALLRRMEVNPKAIDRIQNDPLYSKRAWRSELFYKHGLKVTKYPDKIEVKRHAAEYDDLVLGEWREPEIIHVKQGKKHHCELHLKYWQLI